jgi:hypothetical protein
VGRWRMNEGELRKGIWLMDFIYLYEIEQRNFLQLFKRGREGIEGEKR